MNPLNQLIEFLLINESTELPPPASAFIVTEDLYQLMTENLENIITE
jgi:hypothetical protein